ncbi:MAG TPA: MlaD family protein [Gemmatimonadales bacterium]|nr:MlaD family protein [Gemmatimonadales bacterium]
MAVNVQRTDLYVGVFLVATVALVAIALIATSGWGVDRYDVYVRTDNAQDIAPDTKIYLQGLEVGRVAAIAPLPLGGAGRLQFIVRLRLVDRFPDGTPLRLPRGTYAEASSGLLGGSQLELSVRRDSGGTLAPGDTISMQRGTSPLEAFGDLARDLKSTIQHALVSATGTMDMVRVLADSLRLATGTARRLLIATQPGAERMLAGVNANLDRLQVVLDSTNTRTGLTFQQVDATLAQSRQLLASLDSLTRQMTGLAGENRPDIRQMIANFRDISAQLGYVLEQLSRRPLRFISGVKIPDSLTFPRAHPAGPDSASPAASPPPPDRARAPAAPDPTRPPPWP